MNFQAHWSPVDNLNFKNQQVSLKTLLKEARFDKMIIAQYQPDDDVAIICVSFPPPLLLHLYLSLSFSSTQPQT